MHDETLCVSFSLLCFLCMDMKEHHVYGLPAGQRMLYTTFQQLFKSFIMRRLTTVNHKWGKLLPPTNISEARWTSASKSWGLTLDNIQESCRLSEWAHSMSQTCLTTGKGGLHKWPKHQWAPQLIKNKNVCVCFTGCLEESCLTSWLRRSH